MNKKTQSILLLGGVILVGTVIYKMTKKNKFYVRDIQGGKPYLCSSSKSGENCSSVSFALNQNFVEDSIGGSEFNYKADLNKERNKTYIRVFDGDGNIVDSIISQYKG